MERKKLIFNLAALISVSAVLYFTLSLQINSLFALLAGIITIYIGFTYLSKNIAQQNIYIAIIGVLLSWLLYDKILYISMFLLGANVCVYYLQIDNLKKKYININLLNTVSITGIVLISGIEKIRGFNKLILVDIRLTPPLILLAGIATFFFISAIYSIIKVKKNLETYKILTAGLVLSVIYFLISYYFYKEVGFDIIWFPLVSGVLAGYLTLLVKPKNFLTSIIEIFLLIILPYQITGLLGVMLSMLSAFVLTDLIGLIILNKKSSISSTIYKLAPLVFLIGAAEIRENKGLITRFNIVSGYQLGWLVIAPVVIEYSSKYIFKLKKILEENEIGMSFSFVAVIFTLLSIMLIMKIGHDESMVALLVVSVIYLFIVGLLDYKRYTLKLRFIASLASTLGVISFLILTRL